MSSSRVQIQRLLHVATAAAGKASTLIQSKIECGFKVANKQDGSFVTSVDTAVEKLIVREIHKSFPDHDVTGEEFGSSKAGSEYRWFIDPIDGTLAFQFGLPFYGTIISLCYKDQPIVGVISHPGLDRVFSAFRGGGAYRDGKKIKIKDVSPGRVKAELIATGDRYQFQKAGALGKYNRLLKEHSLVRTIPDCVGHTLAAEGSVGAMVDFYLSYWDLAATKLIVEEAGGKFVITGTKQLADGRNVYNIICGKPRVVNWLLREIFG